MLNVKQETMNTNFLNHLAWLEKELNSDLQITWRTLEPLDRTPDSSAEN